MNILYLATDAYGTNGGIAQSNQDLLCGLSKIEDIKRINLVTKSGVSIGSPWIDKVKALNVCSVSTLKFILIAMRSAMDGSDIIVCGHINYLYLGVFLKICTKSKLVLMAHGIEVWGKNKKKAFFASWIDSIWHVSFFTKRQISKWLTLNESRYTWLPNLIDLRKYEKRPKNASLQKKYQLENKKVLMTISRLSSSERYKGHDELISVMPQLASLYPDIRYLIVGDGDDRARLESRVNQLGMQDYVEFSGYVSQEEKLDLYSIADVFVMVGSGEGFGLVYLESLACGTPVVGSVLDASQEVLLYGKIGELANPTDPDSIIGAVTRAFMNQNREYPELIEFSWPEYLARVKRAYKELVQ